MHTTTQDRWKTRAMLFFISQSITLFGSTLVQMAIVWYVTRNTSSGAWVAAFSVCSYLPEFVISFSGGVWADRYHRKKLIIGADFFIAVVTLAMMMRMPYISSRSLLLLALLIMSILRSLGAGIQTPAVNAVVPQLVPADQLMRFNGINAAMQSIVRFAAPAAAGVILTIGSLRSTLLIDVLTAVVGIGLLSRISISHERKERGAPVSADLKAGISYAFSDKLIRRLLMVYGLFVFLCVPAGYLAGLFVSRVYGESYGYLTMVELAGFAGMMVGRAADGHMGRLQEPKGYAAIGAGDIWNDGDPHGDVCKFCYLPCLNGGLRGRINDSANGDHHSFTGKDRCCNARTCVRLTRLHVFRLHACWHDGFRPACRCDSFAVDHDCIRHCADCSCHGFAL